MGLVDNIKVGLKEMECRRSELDYRRLRTWLSGRLENTVMALARSVKTGEIPNSFLQQLS